jgi:hypothetical protein
VHEKKKQNRDGKERERRSEMVVVVVVGYPVALYANGAIVATEEE